MSEPWTRRSIVAAAAGVAAVGVVVAAADVVAVGVVAAAGVAAAADVAAAGVADSIGFGFGGGHGCGDRDCSCDGWYESGSDCFGCEGTDGTVALADASLLPMTDGAASQRQQKQHRSHYRWSCSAGDAVWMHGGCIHCLVEQSFCLQQQQQQLQTEQ